MAKRVTKTKEIIAWLILVWATTTHASGCRFRNSEPLDDATFGIHADAGCYNYNRDDLYLGGRLDIALCGFDSRWMPGLMINGTCIPFSTQNPEVLSLIEQSFQDDSTFERFLVCSQAAASCCEQTLRSVDETSGNCPPVWDGWSCYDQTEHGTLVEQVCPSIAYSSHRPPKCAHYSYKQCFPNGTWNDNTDYSTCSSTPRLKARTRWHIAMLWISIIFCLPAFFIFWKYGSLKLQKFYLILLLVVALVTRNFLVILTKSIVIMDELTNAGETVMARNGAACKVLAFFEKLTANFVFTCILLLGIFLHQLLTNVFVARKNSVPNMKWYYIGTSGVSVASAVCWAIVMAVHANEHCWMVIDDTNFQWIFDAPRLLMLLVSAGLMLHIIVSLWRTFRYRPNEQHVAIRTARVTLYCAPIFACHFFFVLIRPNTESCTWEQVYYFIVYFVEGLQGILVVLLKFYTDREVVRVLKLSYNRFAFAFNHRFSIYRRAGSGASSNTEQVPVSVVDNPKIEAAKQQRSAPDIIPVDFATTTNQNAPEDDWDPSISDLHVSLVSMDFGEDDEVVFYDEAVVHDRKRTFEEPIQEMNETECSEDLKKVEIPVGVRRAHDMHPKLFMKDRGNGIVFLENEEKI